MRSSTEPLDGELFAAVLESVATDDSVVDLLAQLADPGRLALRCAWCGRMELAGGWAEVPLGEQALRLLHERTTHGICPACLARELGGGTVADDLDEAG